MARQFASVLVLAAALALGVGRLAHASSSCLKNAQTDYATCKAQCQSDFLDEKAACLHISPGCLDACIDGRTECLDLASQPLTACLATCDPPLDTAKADCRTRCGCGAPGNPCGFDACFLGCVTPAETVAFECRKECQDAFRLNTTAQAALAACRTKFQNCLKSCQTSVSGAFLN